MDREGKFVFVNQALLDFWGLQAAAIEGKAISELPSAQGLAQKFEQQIQQIVENKTRLTDEATFVGHDNSARIHEYVLNPSFDKERNVNLIVVSTRDVTERKNLEQERRNADRRKNEFLATMGHELRNPLAAISSGLELIRRRGIDSEPLDNGHLDSELGSRGATLAIVEHQIEHMVHLVNDLLDISRITQDKIKLKKERVEFKTVVDMTLESVSSILEKSNQRLTVSLANGPVYLDADVTRISQLFFNLLENASKYTPVGGQISLLTEVDDKTLLVRISDTGLGIEPEMLSKIFEMFSQAEIVLDKSRGGARHRA